MEFKNFPAKKNKNTTNNQILTRQRYAAGRNDKGVASVKWCNGVLRI